MHGPKHLALIKHALYPKIIDSCCNIKLFIGSVAERVKASFLGRVDNVIA